MILCTLHVTIESYDGNLNRRKKAKETMSQFEPNCFAFRGPGGTHLDQMGMCHQRLKLITLFWSGKT